MIDYRLSIVEDLRKERKILKEKNLILKILLNYLVLLICIIDHIVFGVFLILPIVQMCISIFNCISSKKWQTVLMLEVNLWISTVLGLSLNKYLFLKYTVNDEISAAMLSAMVMIGAVLVFFMAIVTTLTKYFSTKSNAKN